MMAFGRAVTLSGLGILLTVGRVAGQPFLDFPSPRGTLGGQYQEFFKLLSAPAATGPCPATVGQLTRKLHLMDPNVVEHLAARDMEA
jgi:hypothetical protein